MTRQVMELKREMIGPLNGKGEKLGLLASIPAISTKKKG